MDTAPAEGSTARAPYRLNGAVTAVVIPVPSADAVVRPQLPPALLPSDGSTAAHITLLTPFLARGRIDDGVVAELERCFADVPAFEFTLTELCEFPDGVAYLSPEPAAPFRRLSFDLHRRFPETSPEGVAFDDVVPHLTVPLLADQTLEDLRLHLRPRLPLTAHAVEACLVHVEEEDTHVIATLPFGTSAA